MPTLRLTDEARNRIYDSRSPTRVWKETGIRGADGMWTIPISEENSDRLETKRFAGESDSDLILRLFAKAEGLQ